jgi:hypothetical protein
VSALQVAIILLWLCAFGDTLGTPHQTWYFFLPCACLILPTLSTAAAWRLRASRTKFGCLAFYGLSLVLCANFMAFLAIVMLSGGGV